MKIIECPRDAMQGLADFVPTGLKARYINALLKVGYDTIDFGSFVSPKAIPQMRDTAEVLSQLDLSNTPSKLLAIIANMRGATDAVLHDEIEYLGFPLSVSETFQQRNTNKSIAQAMEQLEEIQNLCTIKNKKLVTYISMGFGNPYGEAYNSGVVSDFVGKLAGMGIKIIALSDTIGSSTPELIGKIFTEVIPAFPDVEIGAHLHSTPETAYEKVKAAHEAGCQRFDGAIGGMGGCPMAKDSLTGNMPGETILKYLNDNSIKHGLNETAFQEARKIKAEIFG